MFIAREKELAVLENAYSSNSFEMMVVYGRRRVGKTALLNQFIKEKANAQFFTAQKGAKQENLARLSMAITEFLGISSALTSSDQLLSQAQATSLEFSFNSFESAFAALFEKAKTQRVVFVIDEYPYLAESYPAVSSLLQTLIDRYKAKSKLMLVLCGSSMSFMEKQVLGEKSSLYGRRTGQIKLEPFDAFDAAKLTQPSTPTKCVELYALTGGIPLYLEQLNGEKSTEWNIANNLLKNGSYLSVEPENYMLQELRTPALYNSIIAAIANGCTRPQEIADRIGSNGAQVQQYLKRLEELQIIKKEEPILQSKKRKAHYRLIDNLFAFHYLFARRYATAIDAGMEDQIAKRIVASELSDYVGHIFEDVCRQWVLREIQASRLDLLPTGIGSWWGTDPQEKQEEEIDVVVSDADGKLLLGECKWRNEKTDVSVLQTLQRRSRLVDGGAHAQLYLFSKSGFTEGCVEAAQEVGARLVTVDDMFGSLIAADD